MKKVCLLVFFLCYTCALSATDIEWVGSGTAFSDNSTTLSVSKPAGTSSGDLILIQAGYTSSNGSITLPSGFTAYVNTGANALEYSFCYRIADGTEGSSFSFTSAGNRNWIGSIAIYRNVNPGTPFEDIDFVFGTMTSGDALFTAPAVNSSAGEGVHLVFGMAKHSGTPASITTPSGMTRLTDTLTANRMIHQAAQTITGSGSTGTKDIAFSASIAGAANDRRYFTVSLILRPLRILYSYQSGNYDSASTWTRDPSVSTLSPSGGLIPTSSDSVVIKNGRTVLVSADKSSTGIGLYLEEGGVLDLQTFTLDGLNSISGQGRLRSSRTTGSITYFPTASSNTDFLGSTGGILEYYCTSDVTWNTGITSCRHVELKRESSGTTQYTLASNLTLSGNLVLSRTGSAVSRLTIGNNTTNRTLTIAGNAVVGEGCEWRVGNFDSDHAINLSGNLTNNGSIRFTNQATPNYATEPTTGTSILNFQGSSNASLECYGQTDLYRLIINKGTDQTYIVSVESNDSTHLELFGTNDLSNNPDDDPDPTVRKALTIQNGTLKLNENIYLPCLSTAGDDFTIPENAALWINGAHVVSTTGTGTNTGITVIGLLRMTSGRLELGTSTGLLYRVNGVIQIEGGYVHAAQFRQSEPDLHYGSYIQSGGHVVIDGTTEDADHARFSLPNSDCVFTMSGGLLEIKYPVNRAGTAVNLIDIATSSANFLSTGGEIQAVSNRASEIGYFSLSGSLYQLTFLDAGGLKFMSKTDLLIEHELIFDTGSPEIDMDDFDLILSGDFTIESGAILDIGTGALQFVGDANQLFTLDGTLTGDLENLVIDKEDTLEIAGTASSIVVGGDFFLLNGVLNDGGKTLDIRGDLTLSSTHIGTGKLLLSTATARTVTGNGSGVVTNLEYNSSGDAIVTFGCNLKIKGELEFIGTARRILDMVSYNLTLDSFATVVNPASNRFIRFNGLQSAGGFTKVYSNDSFFFPIGSGTGGTYDYAPANIYFTSSPTTRGSITIKPVASEHLAVTTNGRSLTYYWKTSSSGFVLGSAELVQDYIYLAADVVTGTGITEAGYVPARFDLGAGEWVVGSSSTINTSTNTVTFTGITFPTIDGDYTAGDNDPINPFGAVEIYYSLVDNGDWADINTWTTNPDHTTPSPPATIPNANTILRIGNGTSVFHTIEVSSNGANLGSLVIYEGSTLDINATTGHNFGFVAGQASGGKGAIRMDRNAATYVFPGGDFGEFLAAGGGEIEYYNSTASTVTIPSTPTSYNRLVINAQSSGIINFPPIDLTINDSLIIQSTGAAACYLNPTDVATGNIVIEKSLVVLDGILEVRNPGNSATREYVVKGDVRIASGASFRIQTNGSSLIHNLEIEGDLVNEGTFDIHANTTRNIALLFSGEDTAYFTGTNGSASTDIYLLTLDKGADKSAMLVIDIAGTLSTRTNNWLTLMNGTLRWAKSGSTLTVWDDAVTFEIPATSALSVDHSTAILNLAQDNNNNADLILSGRLEVLSGTINVGTTANNNNNDIILSTSGIPEIILTGGTLNVNGQIRRSTSSTAGSLYYSQSGGSLVRVYGRSHNNTRGKLEVVNTGSYFEMSDSSSLYIVRGSAVDFPDLYLNPASSNLSSGTIYFQPITPTTGNETYTCNSSIALNHVSVLSSGGRTATLGLNTNNLSIKGDLIVGTSGTLTTNNLALTVQGRFDKTGTYTGGTSTLTFAGTSSAIVGDFSAQSIYHLKVDTNAVLSLSGIGTNVRISSLLTLSSGALLHDSAHLIDIKGAMVNNGEHRSLSNTASNTLQFTGTASQTVSGSGIFGNVVVNNGYTVSFLGAMQINRQLTLTNGSLEIGEYRLTLEESATLSGSFGAAQHIRTNGVYSDAGILKKCATGANDLYFPLGLTGKFTPARINITASNAPGTVSIRVVNSKHPSTRVSADSQLNLYWFVDTTGFNSLTVTHTYEYIEADVTGIESNYRVGRYVRPNWTPLLGIGSALNTSTNTISLAGVSYINGAFTAGVANEFAAGNTYYSRKSSGNWTDLDMWSISGHGGSPLGSVSELPEGAPIIIASGDTVTISGNSKLAESISLLGNAVLDLGNTYAHNFGEVSGTGTLRIKATGGGQFIFPAGTFDAFCGSSGGTVEFYDATNGTLPTRSVYHNLRLTNSATRTQSNVDITIHGDFRISGGVFSNITFNRNLIVHGDWLNEVGTSGYLPGSGTVNFASNAAQNIDGITRFHSLEMSGGGTKTLLDSITLGGQLSMSGGLFYLGSNNLMADSAATSGGTPSATAMVIQNGTGRIVKRYKSTSPSFTYPLGEQTGTTEYSPVTLSFNSGTYSSLAIVSVQVVDTASPSCAGGSHYTSRYWTFSASGVSAFSANVTAKYLAADVVGTESLIGARMSRPSLPCVNGSAANIGARTLSFTGTVLNIFTGGEAPIAQPTLQASFLFFTQIAPGQMKLTWTKGNGQGRLVLAKQASAVNVSPTDLVEYTASSNFSGSPQNLGSNNYAVYQGSDSTFTLTGLSPEVYYHFAIFEYNNQGSERDYLLTGPLVGVMKTLANEPTVIASTLSFDRIQHNTIRLQWSGGNGTNKLVIARKEQLVSAVPVDRLVYSANGTMGAGHDFGNEQFAVYAGDDDTVTVANLDQNSYYHFAVFEWNGSDSGANYLTSSHFNDTQHTYLLLELTVFLEGAYFNGYMYTENQPNLSKQQPYGATPYIFTDYDSIGILPVDSLVDWVMIELRKFNSAATAGASTIKARELGFLRPNGRLIDTAGAMGVIMATDEPGDFFVVVHHRTHISVMSSAYLTEPDLMAPYYSYNFSDGSAQAFGTNALIDLGGGRYGLYSGRAENTSTPQTIDNHDWIVLWDDRNLPGYRQADVNLDGRVDASDRSTGWNNRNIATQVPD